jgi:hypothetical protein
MVRRRGRLREGLDAVELVTRPMRGAPVRGSASQLLSSIESCRGDRGFWLKLPRTSLGAVFLSSAVAWPIREAWWEGAGF